MSSASADRESHLGALFGADPSDTWGIGGLTLSGPYEGGGGNNLGIGINDVGGLSASLDRRIGSGDPGGWGHGCGGKPCLVGGTHKVGAGLRMPREIATNGRLPKDVIQRIIRQNAGRYRACYESALRTNPALEGRVEVRFVIDRQGQVSMAQDGSSGPPERRGAELHREELLLALVPVAGQRDGHGRLPDGAHADELARTRRCRLPSRDLASSESSSQTPESTSQTSRRP